MNYNKKYQEDYTYIYNASVFHDDNFNEGKLDSEWANQFAEIYFALNHREGAYPGEKDEFINGWHDFFYHMFD